MAIRGVDILYLGKRDRRKAGWRSTRNFDPVVQSSLQAQHQNVKLEIESVEYKAHGNLESSDLTNLMQDF